MSTAAIIAGTIGAVGSIGSAAIGSAGAQNAADTQAQAAEKAAQLQYQEQQQALAQQQSMFNIQQANQQPFLQAGQAAVGTLQKDILQPGGPFQPWTQQFQAPTAAQAAATPGYQFALQQGLGALQANAAARGTLLSGGTGEALSQYAQGLASNTYQQTYNNALTQYQQAYNQFQQGQANTYNRLAGLAGTGQVAANTLGQNASTNAALGTQTALQGGAQIAQQINNQAAATASGYIGQANAWGGALGNLGNTATNSLLLNNLLNSQGNISNAAGNLSDYNLPQSPLSALNLGNPGTVAQPSIPSFQSGIQAPSSPYVPSEYDTAP